MPLMPVNMRALTDDVAIPEGYSLRAVRDTPIRLCLEIEDELWGLGGLNLDSGESVAPQSGGELRHARQEGSLRAGGPPMERLHTTGGPKGKRDQEHESCH